MRHLGSLAAGHVVTPIAWLLLAYGQGHAYANWNDNPTHNYFWYEPVLFLVVAGLLVGLLASTRISPVGPAFAGVIFLAVGVTALAVKDVYNLVPKGFTVSLGGVDRAFALRLPIDNGTAVLLGTAMLVAVVSAGRWRSWPQPAGAPAESTGAAEETAAVTAGEPGPDEPPTPVWPTPAEEPFESRSSIDEYPTTFTKEQPPAGSPWSVPPTQGANQG